MQVNQLEKNTITIPMAGLKVAQGNTIIKTFVGSCVAICIFDKTKKIGGMAHVMLPRNNTGKTTMGTKQEGKFADESIELIVKKIQEISNKSNLEAKISGGAKIFSHENETGILDIGNRNITAIHEILREKNIPIVSKVVGSSNGRWVSFDCSSQKMIVKEKGVEKII